MDMVSLLIMRKDATVEVIGRKANYSFNIAFA